MTIGHVNLLLASGAHGCIETLVADAAERPAVGHYVALAAKRRFTLTTDKVFCMPAVTLGLGALVGKYDLQTSRNVT